MSASENSVSNGNQDLGRFLFYLGGLVGLLGLLQRFGWPLPYFFGEWMLITLSLGTALAGAIMTWQTDHPRTDWRPTRSGQRFQTLVLYTRPGCGLCDEAHVLLASYHAYLPDVVEVNIDADPELRTRFDTCVPVVELDGKVRFRGHVSETLLRRLIEGTPVLTGSCHPG